VRVVDIQEEDDVICRVVFGNEGDCLRVYSTLVASSEDIYIFDLLVDELARRALSVGNVNKTVDDLALVARVTVAEVTPSLASENKARFLVGQRNSAHNK